MCGQSEKLKSSGRRKKLVEVLECDKCLRAFHLDCLAPPLTKVPEVRAPFSHPCAPAGLAVQRLCRLH